MYYDCEGKQSVHCDPKMQELENRPALGGEARAKAWQASPKYAHDQVVTVPIGYPYNYYAMSARLDWDRVPKG